MTFNFDLTVTIGVIVTVALAVIGWFQMRGKDVDRRIGACDDRLDRHDQRIMAAEQTLKSMPGKDDIHSLSISMAQMQGDIRAMGASVEGQRQILTRLENVVSRQEDHLLRGKS